MRFFIFVILGSLSGILVIADDESYYSFIGTECDAIGYAHRMDDSLPICVIQDKYQPMADSFYSQLFDIVDVNKLVLVSEGLMDSLNRDNKLLRILMPSLAVTPYAFERGFIRALGAETRNGELKSSMQSDSAFDEKRMHIIAKLCEFDADLDMNQAQRDYQISVKGALNYADSIFIYNTLIPRSKINEKFEHSLLYWREYAIRHGYAPLISCGLYHTARLYLRKEIRGFAVFYDAKQLDKLMLNIAGEMAIIKHFSAKKQEE